MIKGASPYLRKTINAGFYALVFSSPFSISATQISLSLIIISWMALMAVERRVILARTALALPFVAYLFASLVSALLGRDVLRSLNAMSGNWTALTFFAAATFIEDARLLRRLAYVLVTAAAVASVYGVLQHLYPGLDIVRSEGRRIVQWTAEGGVASTGFFDHHLTYGGYLLLVLPLAFGLCLSGLKANFGHGRRSSVAGLVFHLMAPALISAGLIASMARSAWIGGLFAISVMVVLLVGRRKLVLSIAASVFILLLALSVSFPRVFDDPLLGRLRGIFDISANVERIYIWESSIDMIMDHPVTGVGGDNYSRAIMGYRAGYDHEFSAGSNSHAHNNLLTEAAVHGVIGLAAFLWVWVAFFREGARVYASCPGEGRMPIKPRDGLIQAHIAVAGLGAVAGLHLAGMFESNFWDSEVNTIMWFMAGLVLAAGRMPPSDPPA
jgi:O-antigen ligase